MQLIKTKNVIHVTPFTGKKIQSILDDYKADKELYKLMYEEHLNDIRNILKEKNKKMSTIDKKMIKFKEKEFQSFERKIKGLKLKTFEAIKGLVGIDVDENTIFIVKKDLKVETITESRLRVEEQLSRGLITEQEAQTKIAHRKYLHTRKINIKDLKKLLTSEQMKEIAKDKKLTRYELFKDLFKELNISKNQYIKLVGELQIEEETKTLKENELTRFKYYATALGILALLALFVR